MFKIVPNDHRWTDWPLITQYISYIPCTQRSYIPVRRVSLNIWSLAKIQYSITADKLLLNISSYLGLCIMITKIPEDETFEGHPRTWDNNHASHLRWLKAYDVWSVIRHIDWLTEVNVILRKKIFDPVLIEWSWLETL